MPPVTDTLAPRVASRNRSRERWITFALFVVFAVIRLPFRSEFLVNWDAVNFALGIEAFDLGHHQPHAPGYIGYVVLGRVLAAFTGDPNTGLTLLSVLAGGLLPAAFYLLARRMLPRGPALLMAVLVGTSPVVWYYSSVALTYVVGAAVAVLAAWAAHVARTERSRGHLIAAALLLAVLGSLRQTDLVLLLPLLVYAAWAFPRRERLQAAATLTGACLAWSVPLVIQAGGPMRYLELSRELAQLAGGRTWAFGMNPVGLLQNVGLVGAGLLLGLNIALLVLPAALRYWTFGGRTLPRESRRMLWLWAAPALFIYLFVHTGQIGYVLMVLPATMLWIGAMASEVAERLSLTQPARAAARVSGRALRHPRPAVLALVAALVLGNIGASFVFPRASFALLTRGDSARVQDVATSLTDDGVAERTRQYLIGENDEYWDAAVDFVEEFEEDESAILSVPTSVGTFRHLAYYLPDRLVYGIGNDRKGHFGHLFTAVDGHNTYTVAGLAQSRAVLVLPSEVRWLIVPDRLIQEQLPDDLTRRTHDVEVGPSLVAVKVPRGSALLFDRDDDGEITIGAASYLTRIAGSHISGEGRDSDAELNVDGDRLDLGDDDDDRSPPA